MRALFLLVARGLGIRACGTALMGFGCFANCRPLQYPFLTQLGLITMRIPETARDRIYSANGELNEELLVTLGLSCASGSVTPKVTGTLSLMPELLVPLPCRGNDRAGMTPKVTGTPSSICTWFTALSAVSVHGVTSSSRKMTRLLCTPVVTWRQKTWGELQIKGGDSAI